ncbi:RagB/SusD family nutrient uptake outer membrane protein [Flammeovirga yaeyamensis]|uniref:RagB/SusD family nutrient uptake outer membrane protein n=1 Tax=Flammeovirga yaeyamensis TaxID=367791 RepID=A0AAX1N689_9BACT|nr:RagB/SusD family nutrient uptake outer membrane protein [Flammeovirga yaeyamensis]MBB3700765.1 hypothetical protein [Flammeovirga yaeyamensis]NMF37879.1 RagB/SusD family nutrient uptake outer membrane protein [Flammeovirga yaeyamensis]QWG01760.1 RagB/SusD family nutrient uptake outer membrane protein [Flammeovirga yaeyamensis]
MNKKTIYKALIVAVGLLSTGCSDWLTEKNPTQVDNGFVYNTEAGLNTLIVSLYNRERSIIHSSESKDYCVLQVLSDLAVTRGAFNGLQYYNPDMYNPITFEQAETFWKDQYRIIERANGAIESAPNVEMDDLARNQILSEAKVHRAHAYFTLLRLFDNVYLTTTSTTPETALDPDIDYSPASQEEVFELIDSDLDFAIEHLSWEAAVGRHSKSSAAHIRAKSALWQNKYDEAIELTENIIYNSGKALSANTETVFGKNTGVKDVNEALYVMPFDFNLQGNYGGGSKHNVFYMFVPRYYNLDGFALDATQGGRSLSWSAPNNYLLNMYEAGDTRYKDYYRDYLIYNDENSLPSGVQVGDTLKLKIEETDYNNKRISLWKNYDPEMPDDVREGYMDIVKYRLAETYLMAAEAHLKGGSASKGLEFLNAVRTRANATPLTSLDEQAIMDERAMELALEGQRWFYLKRIGKLGSQIRQFAGNDDAHFEGRTNFKDYHSAWPIPQNQIQLMNNFPQNPGY